MIDYPWLMPLYQQLIKQHHQLRGHPAQLLYATPGCGAEQLVVAFARWILCRQPPPPATVPTLAGGCGQCHACTLMLAGSHPDFQLVRLEEGKSQVGVEQIRIMLPYIYTFSQQGGAKVICFIESERLSEAAANALLKMVEEPPPETYFLLLCRSDALLPATVRSRCQQWHLLPPVQSQAVAWLQSHDTNTTLAQAVTALWLSAGAPLAALKLSQGALLQRHDLLLQSLKTALQQHDLLPVLPQLDHEEVQLALYWLAILLLEASKQRLQVPTMVHQIEHSALLVGVITHLAERFTLYQLQRCCRRCLSCRNALRETTGLNRTLVLTELLCQLQEQLLS